MEVAIKICMKCTQAEYMEQWTRGSIRLRTMLHKQRGTRINCIFVCTSSMCWVFIAEKIEISPDFIVFFFSSKSLYESTMDFQGDTDLKAVSTLLTIEVRWCSIFDEELFQLKFFKKVSERDEMDPSPSNLARFSLKISSLDPGETTRLRLWVNLVWIFLHTGYTWIYSSVIGNSIDSTVVIRLIVTIISARLRGWERGDAYSMIIIKCKDTHKTPSIFIRIQLNAEFNEW